MRIELYTNEDQPVPTPFVNGVLQYDFAHFLVMRHRSPTKIRANMRPAGRLTMSHIANDTRLLLENLAANNITPEEATWNEHIEPLLDNLCKRGDWSNETYNIRYSRWRDYFDYLASRGIKINAIFPAQHIRTRTRNDEDDFLNYTRSNSDTYTEDTGHKNTGKKSDYADRVISLDQFHQLHAALLEDDLVYAAMAKFDMLTMLRIENLVQVPYRKSPLNKRNWMIWPEFQRLGRKKLKFNCTAKFGKSIRIDVWPTAIRTLYDEYISKHYKARKELFNNNYMTRKNASLKQGKIILPDDILWITKTGAPVKPYMLQAAFRRAEEKLGFEIEPHFLRHSGATHLLYGYCKKQGIEPDTKEAIVFHQVLKGILAHEQVETTRMYIRTILNQKGSFFIPSIQEDMLNNIQSKLDPEVMAVAKNTVDEFYGYMADQLPDVDTIKNRLNT